MTSDSYPYPELKTDDSIDKIDIKKKEIPLPSSGTQETNKNQEYPLVPSQYPIVKQDHQVTKQDHPVARRKAPSKQDGTAKRERFDKEHGEDKRKGDVDLAEARRPVTCADCGREVETCVECGRVIPPRADACPLCGQTLPDDWLYESRDPRFTETTVCRASTSRKLHKLASECESGDQSNDDSTDDSEDYDKNAPEKPFKIVDSATLLHRNKWQTFRNYFRWFRPPYKFLKFHRSEDSTAENTNETLIAGGRDPCV